MLKIHDSLGIQDIEAIEWIDSYYSEDNHNTTGTKVDLKTGYTYIQDCKINKHILCIQYVECTCIYIICT